ncbi:hypothetical protein LCGC14_3030770 [marine sediment metagenome]|uniref:Uncharacterized protein n=1 Tax=marine sediment metagenome TaxID=412755 RepID=A0A0F8WST7_9ZZZZ
MIRIVIESKNGLVQNVSADRDVVEVVIVDYDVESGENVVEWGDRRAHVLHLSAAYQPVWVHQAFDLAEAGEGEGDERRY